MSSPSWRHSLSRRALPLALAVLENGLCTSKQHEVAREQMMQMSHIILQNLRDGLPTDTAIEWMSAQALSEAPACRLDFGHAWQTIFVRPLLHAELKLVLSYERSEPVAQVVLRLCEDMKARLEYVHKTWTDYLVARLFTGILVKTAIREVAGVAAHFASILGDAKLQEAMIQLDSCMRTCSRKWLEAHETLLDSYLNDVLQNNTLLSRFLQDRSLTEPLIDIRLLLSFESWRSLGKLLFSMEPGGSLLGMDVLQQLSETLLPYTLTRVCWHAKYDDSGLENASSPKVFDVASSILDRLQAPSLATCKPMTRNGVHPLHRETMNQFFVLVNTAVKTVQTVKHLLPGILAHHEYFDWAGTGFGTVENFVSFMKGAPKTMHSLLREAVRVDPDFFACEQGNGSGKLSGSFLKIPQESRSPCAKTSQAQDLLTEANIPLVMHSVPPIQLSSQQLAEARRGSLDALRGQARHPSRELKSEVRDSRLACIQEQLQLCKERRASWKRMTLLGVDLRTMPAGTLGWPLEDSHEHNPETSMHVPPLTPAAGCHHHGGSDMSFFKSEWIMGRASAKT